MEVGQGPNWGCSAKGKKVQKTVCPSIASQISLRWDTQSYGNKLTATKYVLRRMATLLLSIYGSTALCWALAAFSVS
jgi:hypothetical protein